MYFSKDNIISKNHLPYQPEFREGMLFLINKPLEWTSFDVVNKLRFSLKHHLKVKNIKVGHAGTLDPLATGLLLVCCGKSTKMIDALSNMDKCYSGSIFLGATTPSYDKESNPDRYYDITKISEQAITNAITQFVGEQWQVPPLYSAIRVNGKKGYELARRGIDTQMEARKIHIHEFKITSIRLPEIQFYVCCSKGTYIRSLAHDFGKALGAGAYLSALKRESIGPYLNVDALEIEEAVRFINESEIPQAKA